MGFYTNDCRNLRKFQCVCRKHTTLKFPAISETYQPILPKHKFNFTLVMMALSAPEWASPHGTSRLLLSPLSPKCSSCCQWYYPANGRMVGLS